MSEAGKLQLLLTYSYRVIEHSQPTEHAIHFTVIGGLRARYVSPSQCSRCPQSRPTINCFWIGLNGDFAVKYRAHRERWHDRFRRRERSVAICFSSMSTMLKADCHAPSTCVGLLFLPDRGLQWWTHPQSIIRN